MEKSTSGEPRRSPCRIEWLIPPRCSECCWPKALNYKPPLWISASWRNLPCPLVPFSSGIWGVCNAGVQNPGHLAPRPPLGEGETAIGITLSWTSPSIQLGFLFPLLSQRCWSQGHPSNKFLHEKFPLRVCSPTPGELGWEAKRQTVDNSFRAPSGIQPKGLFFYFFPQEFKIKVWQDH